MLFYSAPRAQYEVFERVTIEYLVFAGDMINISPILRVNTNFIQNQLMSTGLSLLRKTTTLLDENPNSKNLLQNFLQKILVNGLLFLALVELGRLESYLSLPFGKEKVHLIALYSGSQQST